MLGIVLGTVLGTLPMCLFNPHRHHTAFRGDFLTHGNLFSDRCVLLATQRLEFQVCMGCEISEMIAYTMKAVRCSIRTRL